jgi:quercetin dioxygenase-like cupin family protein
MIPLVWRMTLLALLLLFGMSGWVSSSTTTADNNDNQIKRTFVNILDNATIDVIKECVDTDNAYSVIDVSSPANNKVPLHHHTKYEEIAQVLEGTLFFQVDKGEPIMLSVGESTSQQGTYVVDSGRTGQVSGHHPALFRWLS